MCTTGGESPLEQMRASVDVLARDNPTAWSDEDVRSSLPALLSTLHQLTAFAAIVLGTFDGRELARSDGLRTSRTWLTAFGRMSQGAATAWLTRARLLRRFPVLADRAVRGLVPVESLRPISDLVERVGAEAVAPFDEILAGLASAASPSEVAAACARIAAHVDPDGAEPDPQAGHHRRCLTLSRSGAMVTVRGQLDLEGGAAVLTALDAVMRPPAPDDPRNAAQRRADALTELAQRALQAGDLPRVQGQRPQLGLLITPTTLLGSPPDPLAFVDDPEDRPNAEALPGAGPPPDDVGRRRQRRGACPAAAGGDAIDWQQRLTAAGVAALPERPWLSWVGEVPAAIAQRIACDCEVWRAVLDPVTGLPLEVGRAHRTVPHWIRKALHARDRGCRWPGCDVPAAWTDSHHLMAWYHGGKSNVDNMLSLCRWHHGKIHEGRWTIRLDPDTGEVYVTRPDGQPYELGPSRPWVSPGRRRGDPTVATVDHTERTERAA